MYVSPQPKRELGPAFPGRSGAATAPRTRAGSLEEPSAIWPDLPPFDIPTKARCVYQAVEGNPAIRVCVTHRPEYGLHGDEWCPWDTEA